MVDGAIPGMVVQSSMRKQGEQANKQHAPTASASAPPPRFLPCVSSCPDFLQ